MSSPRKVFSASLVLLVVAACSQEEGRSLAGQGVAVTLAPEDVEVGLNGSVQFAATVTGTADTIVLWEVVEAGGGAVDAAGLYTAPGAPGTFHVRARSRAAPQVFGESTVSVVAAPAVSVTISPRTATVAAGGSIAFAATVANASNGGVTWSVPLPGCGSVTAAGVYTAPATAAVCTVVATSQEDSSKSDTATVTVTAPVVVTVAVTPSPAAVDACRTLAFTATVTGASDRSVAWSVQEGAPGGTITTAGVYTAPADAGTYHVVATSNADPSRSAVVPVAVADRILGVAVSPETIQVPAGGTAQFTATVTTSCGSYASTATVNSAGQVVAN